MADVDTTPLIEGGPVQNRLALYYDDSDTELEEWNCSFDMDTDVSLPIATIPPRQNKKEGYLFKQGGVNQDKGWKKRYVRFDGQSLRYFMNEKSFTSLRIIPVAIMKEANHEDNSTRPSSGIMGNTSKAHRFTVKTVNRTYLFATDNHDNCVQWVCFLTEAILNKSKGNNTDDVVVGGSMTNPDIQGSFKFWKKSQKYHAALKGDVFRYYYNKEDYEIDCPVHEVLMHLSNVTKVDNARLLLRSAPDQKYMLQFDSPVEADQWYMYFGEAIVNIGDNSIVDQIKQNTDNGTCVDCTATETNWASINLGVVLCIKCAGIHRGLGVNYSKVRSLRMDNIFRENTHLVQLFTRIGNKNANKYWYDNPVANREIDVDTPECIRQKHLYQKYVTKDFVDRSPINSTNLNEEFIAAVRKGDVVNTMRFYESGADLNYSDGDSGMDAMSIAKQEGHAVLLEYLEHNKSRKVEASRPKDKEGGIHKRHGIHHDGYLEKTGPNMKGFLKRWFVLHYNRMTYFDDKKGQNNPKEKGSIDLEHVTCVAVTHCNERQYCFDVTCREKKRLYRFAAPSREERRQWIDNILQVLNVKRYTVNLVLSDRPKNEYNPVYKTGGRLIQKVIRPESIQEKQIYSTQYTVAGYFYVQQHSQGPWIKSWFGMGIQFIDILYLNESHQKEHIPIDPANLHLYKYNAGRSSKMIGDVPTEKQLGEQKAVELQFGERAIRVQGHHTDDTEKLFAILNPRLNT